MRLLHTTRIELAQFPDREVEYAILSHRWREEEVTFQDLDPERKPISRNKKGFAKIEGCCEVAAADGYEWLWVDTCCIDKTSSAELSEAINSMYRWYYGSAVCYAYLDDVVRREDIRTSQWLLRGWTLQELIAPRRLKLLNCKWETIATKEEMSSELSSLTTIPRSVLYGASPPTSYNIAQRMSWASTRTTTRPEDQAYCLMGLFDVNMVPIYGEGLEKAFLRLQDEIMLQNTDQSIFLWMPSHEPYNLGLLATSPQSFCTHQKCFEARFDIPGEELGKHNPYANLFPAFERPSAICVSSDGTITPEDPEATVSPATRNANGVQISLLVWEKTPYKHHKYILVCLDVLLYVPAKGLKQRISLILEREQRQLGDGSVILNGWGMWRRCPHIVRASRYMVAREGNYQRYLSAVSQFSTRDTGRGKMCSFELVYRDRGFFGGGTMDVIALQGDDSTKVFPPSASSFTGTAGVFLLKHSCAKCRADHGEGLVVYFATHGRDGEPRCFVYPHNGKPLDRICRRMECLHTRFQPSLIWKLPCRRSVFATIAPALGAKLPGMKSYRVTVNLSVAK